MEFKEIIKLAQDVRSKYAELENKKYGKNWTKAQIAQGFVGDVGDLMKLVTAKEGVRDIEDVDNKLRHELSDCLWSIIVLSSEYEIDLEKEFVNTMKLIELRIKNS